MHRQPKHSSYGLASQQFRLFDAVANQLPEPARKLESVHSEPYRIRTWQDYEQLEARRRGIDVWVHSVNG
jgi:hypothetical protein